jgi:hypothetical protein
MIFAGGPAEIACDPSGWVTSVRHQSSPGLSYLSGAVVDGLQVDGRALEPQEPEVLVDSDEVEYAYTWPGRLRLVVRHSFAVGWGLRVAFSSLAEVPQTVDRAELRLQPQPEVVPWALTLGVTTAYALLPARGFGPVLGAVLRRGSVAGASQRGLQLSPFELRAGARYVVQLQWDWYARPRDFGQERYPEAPSALSVSAGESVHLRVDEDVAVLAPDDVDVARTPETLELVAEPGRYSFELRSARGTTALDLQWVAPVEEFLSDLVPGVLSGPRTTSGVVRLAGVADALLVQSALARSQVDDQDDAAEALDLFTARLSGAATEEPVALGPLEVAYLCREFDRVGDPELLADASALLLGLPAPQPGLGLAATQLCLRLIVSNQPARAVLSRLAWLLGRLDRGSPPSVADRAAELELMAVTFAGPGATGPGATSATDLIDRLAGLGTLLGAGLIGRAVAPRPVDELTHLVTVFQLLPDGVSDRLTAQWGCSVEALAERTLPELVARLEGKPVSRAHAWLALGLHTG